VYPGPESRFTHKQQAGLDTKVGISSDYTLDLSINPDLGQMEADPSVLNLTSFQFFLRSRDHFFWRATKYLTLNWMEIFLVFMIKLNFWFSL